MSPLNRRQFLQATSASFAASMIGRGGTVSAAEPRLRSNQGRIYKSDKGGSIGKDKEAMVATLKRYKSLGFDGLEAKYPLATDVQVLVAAMREADFPVHGMVGGVHWQLRLSSPDQSIRDQGRQALEDAIKQSHAFGGSSVLLVPGKVTGDDETHDDVWNRSIAEVRKVLPVAARYGVRILVENVWNGFCEEPDQFRDYIDEIGSPWVGVYFDIGNVRKFGKPEDWIRILGTRIVKLDVKDWGQKNGFCRLGEGDVDWSAVRSALAEINFTGWATREGRDHSLQDTAQLIDELLDL